MYGIALWIVTIRRLPLPGCFSFQSPQYSAPPGVEGGDDLKTLIHPLHHDLYLSVPSSLLLRLDYIAIRGPPTRYVILWDVHAPGMPGTFSPPLTSKETVSKRSRHASRYVRYARAVMHVRIANPRWRGKRSRHFRRMRNPQCYVSGKRPMSVTLKSPNRDSTNFILGTVHNSFCRPIILAPFNNNPFAQHGDGGHEQDQLPKTDTSLQ